MSKRTYYKKEVKTYYHKAQEYHSVTDWFMAVFNSIWKDKHGGLLSGKLKAKEELAKEMGKSVWTVQSWVHSKTKINRFPDRHADLLCDAANKILDSNN